MKLKFKVQPFQTHAVEAIADCFAGQPQSEPLSYRIDQGKPKAPARAKQDDLFPLKPVTPSEDGFRNAELGLQPEQLLENIQTVQRRQNLPLSQSLSDFTTVNTKGQRVAAKAAYLKPALEATNIHLDVEMETGTGKTYCYIKTMFELNKRFGWSKFIVMVPSVAIREGVHKSLQITADHFLEGYGKKARFFIYNSKRLHDLESFSSDAGVNVMVINIQAFNARGADNRRIYDELDDFQSRRPIDVIAKNRPILILDEPQKMEGKATQEALPQFNPLMILRYSATHRTQHNLIHRLDALDAYNQKLVKKIAVRGITVKGLSGTHGYLFLEAIEIASGKPPVARLELEVKRGGGIKRILRKVGRNDNLHDLSGGLDQYKGLVVAEIDARIDALSFTNGVALVVGEAHGNVDESTMRRIQIREAIKAHFEKEQVLFQQGIKVLTLFFIDEVAKYRQYDDNGEQPGEYAQIFEEEYNARLNEVLTLEESDYNRYLKGIATQRTHDGYFSIDKKSKRLVNPAVGKRATEADDVDAYDLILKDKERLLSHSEPVRFIFSHSALREGWDNPNVFVIGTLKHSDNTISRRQEVGRGLRLAVNQLGERMDDPATVHQINELTVVASESYQAFVSALQRDISESLAARPRVADAEWFSGKVLKTPEGDLEITPQMAKQLYRYLVKNDYTDDQDHITQAWHDAKRDGTLAELPADLQPHAQQLFELVDATHGDARSIEIDDGRRTKVNPLNQNFERKAFQALWSKINRKAAYTVHFESDELVEKCVAALDGLKVKPMRYVIERGEQKEQASFDELKSGKAFRVAENESEEYKHSAHSGVRYDLLGNLAQATQLTRRTIARMLQGMNRAAFSQYKLNPEDFIAKAATLINEQKATAIVEHIAYDPLAESHTSEIFTREKPKADFSKAFKADHHIYDYVFTDSRVEREFVEKLDASVEVTVYAKLPKSFFIPTPVGNYNPDWAIAFQEGKVKHVYFVAETKGSMSSLDLRTIEQSKIECARRFFARITSEQVKYDVVDSYDKLRELVG